MTVNLIGLVSVWLNYILSEQTLPYCAVRLVCLPIGYETIMKASRKASIESTELQRKRSVEVVNFIRFSLLTNNFRFCCAAQVSRGTHTHYSFV